MQIRFIFIFISFYLFILLFSFLALASLFKSSLEDALKRILTPKRNIDILLDIQAHKKKYNDIPYVIVFMGVNGVGKSTNLYALLLLLCLYLLFIHFYLVYWFVGCSSLSHFISSLILFKYHLPFIKKARSSSLPPPHTTPHTPVLCAVQVQSGVVGEAERPPSSPRRVRHVPLGCGRTAQSALQTAQNRLVRKGIRKRRHGSRSGRN